MQSFNNRLIILKFLLTFKRIRMTLIKQIDNEESKEKINFECETGNYHTFCPISCGAWNETTQQVCVDASKKRTLKSTKW